MRTSTVWKEWYCMDVKNNYMINANELRIGNWINVGVRCEWQPTKILNGDHLSNLLNEHPEHRLYHLEPVPLTPEILKSCGFEKGIELENGWEYSCEEISLQVTDKIKIFLLVGGAENGLEIEIKYLHQLQNIFYWLKSGKELKVNFNVAATI